MREQKQREQTKQNEMVDLNPTTLILIVNGLNAPIKNRKLSDWIGDEDPTISCL